MFGGARFKARLLIINLVLCVALVAPIFAQASVQEIRLVPDARITREMAQAQTLDAETFARAALIASGVGDADMAANLQKLRDVYNRISARLESGLSESGRAEEALRLLYDGVLSRYDENQTRVDVALADGAYNCVSSDIIYMYVMKRIGIPVRAVETQNHAFCFVNVGGRDVDVETTNPYGFNPGERKPLDVQSRQRAWYVVPARNYAGRHTVDDRRIVALVFNNRISYLQRANRNAETLPLAVDAMALQNDSAESRSVFEMCVNNALADFVTTGENENALALIDRVAATFGASAAYQQNAAAAVSNLINACTRRGDYDGAFAVLATHGAKLAASDNRSLYEVALVNKLGNAVETQPLENALTEIHAQRETLSAPGYERLVSLAYSREVRTLAENADWLSAVGVAERGLQEVPGNGNLVRLRNVCQQNFAAEVHNEAAALFNAGERSRALAVVQEGLEKMPDSALLQNDLRRMQ